MILPCRSACFFLGAIVFHQHEAPPEKSETLNANPVGEFQESSQKNPAASSLRSAAPIGTGYIRAVSHGVSCGLGCFAGTSGPHYGFAGAGPYHVHLPYLKRKSGGAVTKSLVIYCL